MLQLFLASFNPNPVKLKPLNLTGILDARLKMDLGSSYQLLLDINTECQDYTTLRYNLGACVWVETEHLRLLFVKARAAQQTEVDGVVKLTFYEASYMLKYTEPQLLYVPFIGSAIEYLSRLSNRFVFNLISPDRQVIIDSGISDNLALLEEVCTKVGGWTWRSAGLTQTTTGQWRPLIEIGTFQELERYDNFDFKYRPFFAKAQPNQNPFDQDTIGLRTLSVESSQFAPKYLLVVGTVGDGATKSSVVTFQTTDYPWLDNQYPIVKIGSNYYLQNTQANATNLDFDIHRVTINSNLQITNSQTSILPGGSAQGGATPLQIVNQNQARQALYNEGVAYLKQRQEAAVYKFEAIYPQIILPGNRIKLDYTEMQTSFGDTKVIFDLDDILIARNLDFNLKNYV